MSFFNKQTATAWLLLSVICLSWIGNLPAQDDQKQKAEIKIAITNSSGKPVEKVTAFWFNKGKSKRLSQTDGHVIVGAAEGLVVVQSEGYQYAGFVLHKKTTDELARASIVLRAPDEPGRMLKTLPVPISAEQRKEITSAVTELYWTQLKSNPKDVSNQMTCFELLGGLDPKGLIEFLDANDMDLQFKSLGKQSVVKALGRIDPELAIEVADSVADPMRRSGVLRNLLKSLPENSPYIEAVEGQIIETIKSISQPAFRYAVWSGLAEYYIHSGRPELAQKIVDENLAEVKKLPAGGWAAYPKSCFAALVVENDPELAMKMIEGCKGHERPRALGRLAFHSCTTHPKRAIELLGQIEQQERALSGFENMIKVAHRMAGPQTEAALEVAASIDEVNQKAWAWGMIAMKLADTDKENSQKALENAIQTLVNKAALGAKPNAYLSVSATMAGLLPIAEKTAPEKVEPMIWEAVWLSIPRSRWNLGGGSKNEKLQNVAAAISRYDRGLAHALVGSDDLSIGTDPSRSAVSQVVLNVEGVPEFMDRLNSGPRYSGVFHPCAKVALMLAGSDEEFWNEVSLPSFLAWPTKTYEDH